MRSLFLAACLLLAALACSPGVTVIPASPAPLPSPSATPTPPSPSPTPTQPPPPLPKAILGAHTLYLEVADTAQERARGLMERTSLPLDRAMLFVFESEAPWGFWMKNTLIPLDIVWINTALEVVDVQSMAPEPGQADADLTRYYPRGPARYALEMHAGLAQAYQITAGMKVTLDLAEE